MDKDQQAITIIYDELQTGSKSLGGMATSIVKKVGVLDVAELSTNLSAFCEGMLQALEGIAAVTKGYELEAIDITVEVTAKGEIRFIGSAGADVKGGLRMTFKKSKSD